MRSSSLEAIAPTHTQLSQLSHRAPQVAASKKLAENYYRSAAWRSGYEWRQEEKRKEEEEERKLREEEQSTTSKPAPLYHWQQLSTARDYLQAASDHNATIDRIRANNPTSVPLVNSARVMDHFEQFQIDSQSRPYSRNDSNYSQTHRSPTSSTSASRSFSSTGRPRTGVASNSPDRLMKSDIPPGSDESAQDFPTQTLLAGVPLSSNPMPSGNSKFDHSAHWMNPHYPPQSHPSLVQPPFNSHPPIANWQPRGAGALPTHRHTARTDALLHAQSSSKGPIVNADWTQWAKDVEAKLADAKGTLQVTVRGRNTARR